ncbi:hypothetical protein C8Q78DRAFT_603165 [Trametes maxima]|nr:hypothetical protein C8Q78DRAFT_603165 [Trametes maxima]
MASLSRPCVSLPAVSPSMTRQCARRPPREAEPASRNISQRVDSSGSGSCTTRAVPRYMKCTSTSRTAAARERRGLHAGKSHSSVISNAYPPLASHGASQIARKKSVEPAVAALRLTTVAPRPCSNGSPGPQRCNARPNKVLASVVPERPHPSARLPLTAGQAFRADHYDTLLPSSISPLSRSAPRIEVVRLLARSTTRPLICSTAQPATPAHCACALTYPA